MFVLTSRGWIRVCCRADRSREGSTDDFSRRVAERSFAPKIARDFFTRCFALFFHLRKQADSKKIEIFAVVGSVPDSPTCPISSRVSPLPRSVFPDISLSRHLYVAMRVLHLARVAFTRVYSVSYASMVCIVFYVCVLYVVPRNVTWVYVCACLLIVFTEPRCGASSLSRLLLFFLFFFLFLD